MAAYIILIREETIDSTELQIYAKMSPAGLEGFPLFVKALYGKNELIEGDGQPEGIAILEFPTYDKAMTWYTNPLYQAARVHRLKGGRYRSFIVEGI